MSRPSPAAARVALRHPRTLLRRASAQKLKALVRLLAMLPRPLRGALGALLDVVARGILALRGDDDAVGAPLRLLAGWLAGRPGVARAAAERGVAPATSVRTSLQLARLALALGDPTAAGRVTAALAAREAELAPRERRGLGAVAADVALRTGRYAEAARLARQALANGGSGGTVRAILARAEHELRVLEPGWRPPLNARWRAIDPVRGRVLHLLTNSLPYRQAGYTVRAQSIGRAQLGVGLEPHFATRAGFPLVDGVADAPRDELLDGVAYHRLAPNLEPGRDPEGIATVTAAEAGALVERLRPAVLHPASNFLNASVALALRERYGIPVVYEVRGFLEETWASRQDDAGDAADADRYRGAKAAETAAMLAADAVVTLSDTMRDDIVARGCAPDRVVVVPNAVDIERFVPASRDDALAATLGIEPGETVLGYVSSFTGYEGIRYLVEAGAILRDRGRRVRVLLVGDGEERPALEAEARRLGVDDGTVLFSGRVPHERVAAYYGLIDVFVVPRTTDRVARLVTPLKPYEAMALERAVVVSDVPALREIVRDGETGLIFRAEDAESLAAVVDPLLDDPDRRAELGRAARAWVAANRTWAQNGERYRELYVRLGAA